MDGQTDGQTYGRTDKKTNKNKKWCCFNSVISFYCVTIVPFDSIIMYIFGVYECVFSVVAVG